MAVNQVALNGEELINLTNDTVSELSLLSGETAHDASGAQIMGKAQYINPNLIINPNFKINQRGQTSWKVEQHSGVNMPITQVYTVDRWRIMSGSASVSDGTLTLNGTMQQIIEADIGDTFVASIYAESGTASILYDNTTRTITIAGENAIIKWVKLELGTVATPYVDPDPALELVKCQRYYEVLMNHHTDRGIIGIITKATQRCHFDIPFKTSKRIPPSLVGTKARLVLCNEYTGSLYYVGTVDLEFVTADINGRLLRTSEIPEISSFVQEGFISATLDTLEVGEAIAVS
jgi:hypothetical protein